MGQGECTPVIVFVPYYTDKSAERQSEIDSCLENNVKCDAVSKIVLMVDDGSVPKIKSKKISIHRTQQRPTYQSWIELSRYLPPSSVSVLANSDIAFDRSAYLFDECLKSDRSFVALSRYDQIQQKLVPHPNPHWSQDVWAIKSPAQVSKQLYAALNFQLGIPRCDNRIAYLFKIHGWRVVNPFRDIVATHIHETQLRNYDKKRDSNILGGVAYVHPCGIGENSDIDIDIWTLDDTKVKATKLNASLKHWLAEAPAAEAKSDDGNGEIPEFRVRKPKKTLVRGLAHGFRDLSRKLRNKQRSNGKTHSDPAMVVELEGQDPVSAQPQADDPIVVEPHVETPVVVEPQADGQIESDLEVQDSIELEEADPSESSTIYPTLPTPVAIKLRSPIRGDAHFWQYPCITEKQAFDNHCALPAGSNIDEIERTIHTYLGLPWATYIDRHAIVDDLLDQVRCDIERARSFATENGYSLRVHSVCQHYKWDKIQEAFPRAGITDLHLAHCTEALIEQETDDLHFHSWPLYAPNIENPLRWRGTEIAIPLSERAFLASFIGSYMPHYRSKSRLALEAAAKSDGGRDITVEISKLWHFNRNVYEEQVKGVVLEHEFLAQQLVDAERYNRLLSTSVFSLCPDGAGPNTLRLWESLAVGSIPVVIADGWVSPKLNGADLEQACIFVKEAEIPGIFDRLRNMSATEISERVRACLACYRAARRATCFSPSCFVPKSHTISLADDVDEIVLADAN